MVARLGGALCSIGLDCGQLLISPGNIQACAVRLCIRKEALGRGIAALCNRDWTVKAGAPHPTEPEHSVKMKSECFSWQKADPTASARRCQFGSLLCLGMYFRQHQQPTTHANRAVPPLLRFHFAPAMDPSAHHAAALNLPWPVFPPSSAFV